MADPANPHKQIALIAAPWPALNRPSIQLAALKAYIELHTNWAASSFHPYLHIGRALGPDCYTVLADSSWAGEALFSALIFPERTQLAQKSFAQSLGRSQRQLPSFGQLLTTLESSCTLWLDSIDWHSFSLVGLSLCFNQLFSSLYLASAIKQRVPGLPVVFGGASCAGELGQSLQQAFPQIDYVIDGEGEEPLVGLCRFVSDENAAFPQRVLPVPVGSITAAAPQIKNLADLPLPEYAPYMSEMRQVFPDTPFIPVLPVEFSRGCWWNRCTFCNLNLQWCGYRFKDSRRMSLEINTLLTRYRCLDFTFCDNALPPKEADAFFAAMAATGHDCRFFAEIRATGSLAQLRGYRQGGLDTIQVGIEALSSSLLNRMAKGTSAIANIETMKRALAAGIRLEGNLIMEFPGSTAAEVQSTLEVLDYVLPFPPLSPTTFFLGHGSPIDKEPSNYLIGAVVKHRHYRRLLPAKILDQLTLLVKEYQGDRTIQRRRWRPVRERISQWHQFHQQRRATAVAPLCYRDGGEFLIIRQERVNGPPLRHRLQGMSRAIYLCCEEIQTVQQITTRFPGLKESAILTFIHQMCQKRLMFREEDQVLSLAVRSQLSTQ